MFSRKASCCALLFPVLRKARRQPPKLFDSAAAKIYLHSLWCWGLSWSSEKRKHLSNACVSPCFKSAPSIVTVMSSVNIHYLTYNTQSLPLKSRGTLPALVKFTMIVPLLLILRMGDNESSNIIKQIHLCALNVWCQRSTILAFGLGFFIVSDLCRCHEPFKTCNRYPVQLRCPNVFLGAVFLKLWEILALSCCPRKP